MCKQRENYALPFLSLEFYQEWFNSSETHLTDSIAACVIYVSIRRQRRYNVSSNCLTYIQNCFSEGGATFHHFIMSFRVMVLKHSVRCLHFPLFSLLENTFSVTLFLNYVCRWIMFHSRIVKLIPQNTFDKRGRHWNDTW